MAITIEPRHTRRPACTDNKIIRVGSGQCLRQSYLAIVDSVNVLQQNLQYNKFIIESTKISGFDKSLFN